MSSPPGAVTLIAPFEVAPDADEAFIAAWQGARDVLAGFGSVALLRALRPDVEFRFVVVARGEIAGREPPGDEIPFASHPALYEAVHEDGTPDGVEGATLVNAFEVAPEDDDAFLAGWRRARNAVAGEHGYLGTRLHRSVGPADFRFVNVARWSSPLMFSRALARPEFQEAAGEIRFASHPALYQVVRDRPHA